jgi:hypothetical protein
VKKYRVHRGLDYPPNKRAEIGDVVSDIPEKSVKWLLETNVIEALEDDRQAKAPKSLQDKKTVLGDGE